MMPCEPMARRMGRVPTMSRPGPAMHMAPGCCWLFRSAMPGIVRATLGSGTRHPRPSRVRTPRLALWKPCLAALRKPRPRIAPPERTRPVSPSGMQRPDADVCVAASPTTKRATPGDDAGGGDCRVKHQAPPDGGARRRVCVRRTGTGASGRETCRGL